MDIRRVRELLEAVARGTASVDQAAGALKDLPFADLGYARGAFPQAERAALESLAIPVYGELTAEQQGHVVSTVAAFVHRDVGAAR